MFKHMQQFSKLDGSLHDLLLDIKYCDKLKRKIWAIWAMQSWWRMLGADRLPLQLEPSPAPSIHLFLLCRGRSRLQQDQG